MADSDRVLDPVVEWYKQGVDRSLIRQNLRRSPHERIDALIALQRVAEEAWRAGAVVKRSAR